jgi:hypothetical protein
MLVAMEKVRMLLKAYAEMEDLPWATFSTFCDPVDVVDR